MDFLKLNLEHKKMTQQIKYFLFIFLLTLSNAFAIPNNGELEVMQTQATLAFHSKQFQQAREHIKSILNSDPNNISALELLALVEKENKNDQEAAKAYLKLIKAGTKEKKPAYAFELGSIRYNQKKINEAKKYFEYSAHYKFNPGVSHFFLGLIDFNEKNFKLARNHFSAALTYSDAQAMEPISRYYLASSYAQIGKSDDAIHNYYEVTNIVAENKNYSNDKMTAELRRNALKELSALDKQQLFLNATLQAQWDSNVQTNPSEVDNPVARSNQRSLKNVLSAVAGYSSSPTKKIQVAPSFKFYTNYNYNQYARDYNFVTTSGTVYTMFRPYARLAAGLKTEGTFSMKNNLKSTDSRETLRYEKYSLTGDIGPVVKFELTPKVRLSFELTWRPKNFYTDPENGDTRRSGHGIFSRISSDFITDYEEVNPTVYLSYEWDNPIGKTYRVRTFGLGASNPIALHEKFTLTPYLDILFSDYYETLAPKRDDTNVSFRLVGSYAVNEKWNLLADAAYVLNDSSDSTSYKYNRFMGSLGASYNF